MIADAPSGRGELGQGRRHRLLAERPLGDSPGAGHRRNARAGHPVRPGKGDDAPLALLPSRRQALPVSAARARLRQARGRPAHARLDRLAGDAGADRGLDERGLRRAGLPPLREVGQLERVAFRRGRRRLVDRPVPVVKEKLSFLEAKNLVVLSASSSGTLVYLPEAVPQDHTAVVRLGRPGAGSRSARSAVQLGAPNPHSPTARRSPSRSSSPTGRQATLDRGPAVRAELPPHAEERHLLRAGLVARLGAADVHVPPAEGRPGPLRPVAARGGRRRAAPRVAELEDHGQLDATDSPCSWTSRTP